LLIFAVEAAAKIMYLLREARYWILHHYLSRVWPRRKNLALPFIGNQRKGIRFFLQNKIRSVVDVFRLPRIGWLE
jgi:hypothetical protein